MHDRSPGIDAVYLCRYRRADVHTLERGVSAELIEGWRRRRRTGHHEVAVEGPLRRNRDLRRFGSQLRRHAGRGPRSYIDKGDLEARAFTGLRGPVTVAVRAAV